MTCIAALVDDKGDVWVGGDSAGIDVDSLRLQVGLESKVWQNGGVVFGGCGSFRVMQLLRYQMNVPAAHPDDDLMTWLTGPLVEAMRVTLMSHGSLTVWNETSTEEILESGFLIACRGRLFEVFEDFGVGEFVDGFASIGCGSSYALGALATTAHLKPRKRILSALAVSERFSAGVRGPFTIERIKAAP